MTTTKTTAELIARIKTAVDNGQTVRVSNHAVVEKHAAGYMIVDRATSRPYVIALTWTNGVTPNFDPAHVTFE